MREEHIIKNLGDENEMNSTVSLVTTCGQSWITVDCQQCSRTRLSIVESCNSFAQMEPN